MDTINNQTLKSLGKRSIAAFTSILNSALRFNYFPTTWKTAIVLPFCKPQKDPRNPSNYRPISLLSSLSKIFETLIHHRLLHFTTINKIIPPTQFGFTHQHATTHQLLRLTEHIENSFHLKQHTIVLLLDIEKAFDKIWHHGLIYKLFQIGIPTYLFKIIQNFLSNRTFRVKINSSFSQLFSIGAGVPQGSCLSPLLFNIYLSDIPNFTYSELALFADDTAFFISHKNLTTAKNRLQSDLLLYTNWTSKWQIKINMNKCQAKIFTLCKPIIPAEILILDQAIPWISPNTPIKYLGLLLDTKLKWNAHIKNIIHKTNTKIYKLHSLINYKSPINIHSAKLIYTTIIRPTLTYACPIWSNAAKTHINKLQILQNKFIRKIFHAPWYIPNSQLHNELKIDTINSLIRSQSLKFFNSLDDLQQTRTFNLGQTYHFPRRILSKFPKDIFHPP